MLRLLLLEGRLPAQRIYSNAILCQRSGLLDRGRICDFAVVGVGAIVVVEVVASIADRKGASGHAAACSHGAAAGHDAAVLVGAGALDI